MFLQEWWKDQDKIHTLTKHIKRILYGGAPLNKLVGDDIRAKGIMLDCFYGA